MREGQNWPELGGLSLPSLSHVCPRAEAGLQGAGRTVPGCVLCMLHAGLGDKHLFLQAPSHALTLFTHTCSCQIQRCSHTCTHPTPVQSWHVTDFPLWPSVPRHAPSGPIPLGWALPQGVQNMHVTIHQPFRVVTWGGRANLWV